MFSLFYLVYGEDQGRSQIFMLGGRNFFTARYYYSPIY